MFDKFIITPEKRSKPYKRNNLIVQDIFTRRNTDNLNNLLNNIERFSYAKLNPGSSSINFSKEYQKIFYILKGLGEVKDFNRDEKAGLTEGYAFIVPQDTPYSLQNNAREPLEILVITETSSKRNERIIVKDTKEIEFDKFTPLLHWCHRSKTIFSNEKDDLSKLHYVSLVEIEPKKLAEPHKHFPGHDEVWFTLEGKSFMALKDDLIEHNPGTAILIPDNTEHASITLDKRAKFFFFMHHFALDNKILITGSEGTIGRIVLDHLKNNLGYQYIMGLDREAPNGIDILQQDIDKFFSDIHTVIHLAANPNPFMGKEEAKMNIAITKKVIEACRKYKPTRIINASSINVYPYRNIERIEENTKLEPNVFTKNGRKYRNYSSAKIESERLFEEFCNEHKISLLNLRLGWVTKNDKHPPYAKDRPHPRDIEIALKHEDLRKIVEKAVNYNGVGSYICVSNRENFIGKDILFPI